MMKLKRLVIGCLLLCLWPQSGFADHEKDEPSDGTVKSFVKVSPPKQVSLVPLLKIDGTHFDLTEFKGKFVLVNLWATWCPPCIRELPALDRLQKMYGGKHFEVVAISIDIKGPKASKRMLQRLGIKNLEFYYAKPGEVSDTFPVDVLPANFILDREGRLIRYVRSYVDWDSHEALDYFWELITTPVGSKRQAQ